jgi:hypothetical protein
MEFKGAIPDGADGNTVRGRFYNNNNSGMGAVVTSAICVDRFPGIRNVDSGGNGSVSCNQGERIMGGGAFVRRDAGRLYYSYPYFGHDGTAEWTAAASDQIAVRVICAPEDRLAGLVESKQTYFQRFRGNTDMQLACPNSGVALAIGFFLHPEAAMRGLGNITRIDSSDGSTWGGELFNRVTVAGANQVQGDLIAICIPL